jgi:hypothetical protein
MLNTTIIILKNHWPSNNHLKPRMNQTLFTFEPTSTSSDQPPLQTLQIHTNKTHTPRHKQLKTAASSFAAFCHSRTQ